MSERFKECLQRLKAGQRERHQLITSCPVADLKNILHLATLGTSHIPVMGSSSSKLHASETVVKPTTSSELHEKSTVEQSKSSITPVECADPVSEGEAKEKKGDSRQLSFLDLIEKCVTTCLKEAPAALTTVPVMASADVTSECSSSIESVGNVVEAEKTDGIHTEDLKEEVASTESVPNIFMSLFDKFGFDKIDEEASTDGDEETDSDDDRILPFGSCVVYYPKQKCFKAQNEDGMFFDVPNFAQPQTEEERECWEKDFCGTFEATIKRHALTAVPEPDVENVPVLPASEVIHEEMPEDTSGYTYQDTISSQSVNSDEPTSLRRSTRNRDRRDSDTSSEASWEPSAYHKATTKPRRKPEDYSLRRSPRSSPRMSQQAQKLRRSQRGSQNVKQEVFSSDDDFALTTRTLRSSQPVKQEGLSDEEDIQLSDHSPLRRSTRQKMPIKQEPIDHDEPPSSTSSTTIVEDVTVPPVTTRRRATRGSVKLTTPRAPRSSGKKREVEIIDHKETRGKYMFRVRERGGETRWLEDEYVARIIDPFVGPAYLEACGLPSSRTPMKGTTAHSNKTPSRPTHPSERSLRKPKKIKKEEAEGTPVEIKNGKPYYYVEKILEKRKGKYEDEFHVKWQGYESKDNTWVCRSHIEADQLLRDFEENLEKETAAEGKD